MDIEKLKQKVLDLAIRGKLVPQDPNDEPASVLIEKIKKEKEELIKQGKIKPLKNDAYIYKGSDNCYYENKNGKIKNINDEIPFDIPENWEWIRLNDLSKVIKAGGDKPKMVSKLKTYECNIPIYSNGIQNNGLYGYTNKADVYENSITISARGTIGYVFVRTEPYYPIVRLISVIPYSLLNLNYLMIFLNTMREIGNGSNTPQLTVPDIKTKLIALPPLKEQNRIVNILKIVLEKIDLINNEKKRIKDLIVILKKQILNLIFDDNSSYKSYYENCSILDDIEILDNIRKPINKEERLKRLNKNTLKYPYYGATGIVGEIDDYLYNGELVLLGEDGAPFLNKYANKAYLVNGKFWVNNHAHMLKSKTNNKFLLYYLNWIDYSKYVSGTTRLKLSQHNLIKIPFISCNSKIKKEIVDKIESSVILLEKIKEQIK